jgi:hypothetical protein
MTQKHVGDISSTSWFRSLPRAEQEELRRKARAMPESFGTSEPRFHWLFRRLKCPRCGVREQRGFTANLCRECQASATKARRRETQQLRRGVQAGRLRGYTEDVMFYGKGKIDDPLPFTCGHCGTVFYPQRSSARYCSTKCRVAAHRGQKKKK